jgi:hypothetical protein
MIRSPEEVKRAVDYGLAPADESSLAQYLTSLAEQEMSRGNSCAAFSTSGYQQAVVVGAIRLLRNAGWTASYEADERGGKFVRVSW